MEQRLIYDADLEHLNLFASQAALALDNARQGEHLEFFQRLGGPLRAYSSDRRLLSVLVEQTVRLLGGQYGVVYRLLADQEELPVVATYNSPIHVLGESLKIGKGMAGKLIHHHAPYMIVPDYNAWEGRHEKFSAPGVPTRAVVGVRLEWQGRPVGVLTVGDSIGRQFDSREAFLLKEFADRFLVPLIKDENLYTKDQALEQILQIAKVDDELLKAGKLDDVLAIIERHVSNILHTESLTIFLKDSSGALIPKAPFGYKANHPLPSRECPVCRKDGDALIELTVNEHGLLNLPGTTLQRYHSADGQEDVVTCIHHSILAIPLNKHVGEKKQLLGLLLAENKMDRYSPASRGFTKEDEWLGRILAEEAVNALERTRLVENLRQQHDTVRQLVGDSPQGVAVVDRRGNIIVFNKRAQEITGFTEEEILYTSIQSLYVDPHEPREINRLLHEVGGRFPSRETSIRHKNGHKIAIRLAASLQYNNSGECIGSIGHFDELGSVLQKTESRLKLLLEVSNTVVGAADPSMGLEELCKLLLAELDHTFCYVLLKEDEKSVLRMGAASIAPQAKLQHFRLPEKSWQTTLQDIPGLDGILHKRNTRILQRHEKTARPLFESLSASLELPKTTQSLLLAPLKVPQRTVGLLLLGDVRQTAEGSFTPEQVEFAQGLAAQCALLIDRLTLFQEATLARNRLKAAFHASTALVSSLENKNILQEIVDQARRVANATTTRIILLDAKTGGVLDRAHINTKAESETEGLILLTSESPNRILEAVHDTRKQFILGDKVRPNGISMMVTRTGKPITINNVDNHTPDISIREDLIASGVKAFCCLPLTLENNSLGVMSFYYDHPHDFPQFEIEALQLYANQATALFVNTRRMEKLENMRSTAEALAKMNDISETLHQITENAVKLLHANSGAILLYNSNQYKFIKRGSFTIGISEEARHFIWQQRSGWTAAAKKAMEDGWIGVSNVDDEQWHDLIPESYQRYLRQIDTKSFQSVALVAGTEPLGVLFVNYRTPRSFTEEHRLTAQAFANQVALALQKANLLNRLHKTQSAARKVAELSVLENLEATLRSVVDVTYDVLHCDAVTLHPFDPSKQKISTFPTMKGVWDEAAARRYQEVPEGGLIAELLKNGKIHIVPDASIDPLLQKSRFTKEEKIVSCLGMPLMFGKEPVGLMFANYRSPHRFSAEDIDDIKFFAQQATVAIRNSQLYDQVANQYEKLERRRAHLRALYQASRAITEGINLERDQLLDRIVKQAVESICTSEGPKALFGTLALYDTLTKQLRTVSIYLNPLKNAAPQVKIGTEWLVDVNAPGIGITGKAILTRLSQCVTNVHDVAVYRCIEDATQSELVAPLLDGESVLGVINLESDESGVFDADDENTLVALAEMIVIILRNIRHQEEQQQAQRQVTNAAAIAWTSSASAAWRHAVSGHATTIQDLTELLRIDLTEDKPVGDIRQRLDKIDKMATAIRNTPITTPLSSENGVGSVPIQEFFEERVKQLRDAHWSKSVLFHCPENSGSSLTVRANSEWLQRAFDILFDNAVEAMAASKHWQLGIVLRLVKHGIEIAISDTGKGMTDEVHHKAFQEAFPKPQGTKGSGVGLLLAQMIFERYQGTVQIGVTDSRGTTMLVWLPLESPTPTVTMLHGAQRFLLVSNQQKPSCGSRIKEIVSALGSVEVATEQEAIWCVACDSYDGIIVDTGTIRDAPSCVANIMRQRANAKVVVVAASPDWQAARAVLRVGAVNYIAKTISQDELKAIFNRSSKEMHHV